MAKMCSRPKFAAKGKVEGVARKGLSYEKKVGKHLDRHFAKDHTILRHQWYNYFEAATRTTKPEMNYCQTDYVFVLMDRVIILECKLSQTDRAFEQLHFLYRPILEFIFKKPVIGVQVCRSLNKFPENSILHINELFDKPLDECFKLYTWHLTI